jgi:hypothetical protein
MVKMDLTSCSGAFILLSDGQKYQVDRPVVGFPDTFWVRRSGGFGTIMLSQSAAPTPVVIYDDVHFGRLHWQLTFYDEALGVAVYAEYKFNEDVIEDQVRTGVNPIYLRNVGYRGLVAVLSKGRTLNSPQHGFPVTSVSMNYDWMYDALFPGSVAESAYGHYVLAVFPRPGLVFKPTIRSGVCVDAYFQADRAKEFWTDDRIQYTDSLLLTSAAEFELLLDRRATSRAGALDILCRTEDEQRVWEHRALDDAESRLGLHNKPHSQPHIGFGALYRALLTVRASSAIAEGMLLHLKAPHSEVTMVTGEFTNWAKDPSEGAIPMNKIGDQDWAIVLPGHITPPRHLPYSFKFIVAGQGTHRWANGLYLVDHRDPFRNSLLPVSGLEVTYKRSRALERLQALAE